MVYGLENQIVNSDTSILIMSHGLILIFFLNLIKLVLSHHKHIGDIDTQKDYDVIVWCPFY
jgi:hypothetical protein